MIFKKNIFGQFLLIKKWLIRIIGFISYGRFRKTLKISGSENINKLPAKNVLFVSNHQTYFADGIAILHMLNATCNGRTNTLKKSNYLFNPKLNIYFIAAKETMNKGLIPKILSYTGSISIKRTWKEGKKNINRNVSSIDIRNIKKNGAKQKMEIKKPLEINYDDSIENITKQIGLAIHQDISQKIIR